MWYHIIPLLCIIATSFIYSETFIHKTIVLKSKYQKWVSLNNQIASKERNRIKVLFASTKIVMNALYISFLQYMNNSIRRLDRKTYEVSYVIEGKLYKMIIVPKRGPAPILQILDENLNIVSPYVLPYMGPQYDWHGKRFNPRFFGYKSLTFELGDGTEYTYNDDNEVNI